MNGYINVKFFWGREVIREGNNIMYSIYPRKIQFIRFRTSYDELRNVVYDLMQVIPYHWNIKLSFKYAHFGPFNLVQGFYLAEVCCDADVT